MSVLEFTIKVVVCLSLPIGMLALVLTGHDTGAFILLMAYFITVMLGE